MDRDEELCGQSWVKMFKVIPSVGPLVGAPWLHYSMAEKQKREQPC
jgi:hypothetical protein